MSDWITFGLYFSKTYWPVSFLYWPSVLFTATILPSVWMYTVPEEKRTLEVEAECRIYIVPSEVREYND